MPAGWLRSFEDYYRRQTKNIFNLMVDALTADERRKFIWAEISFLDRWWGECGEERRSKFRRSVCSMTSSVISHTSTSCCYAMCPVTE